MWTNGFAPNVLDAVLVLLLVFAVVRGWRQGSVSQVAAFGGFVLGLLLGLWAAPRVAGLLVGGPGPSMALVALGTLVVAVLVGQGIGLGLGRRLRHGAARLGVERADRVVGAGIGAVALALVVWLLSSVLVHGPIPALAQQIRGSQLVQAFDAVLPAPPALVGRISAYVDDQGFPQVFTTPGRGGITQTPGPVITDPSVRAAAAAARPSTVQIRVAGCGGTIGAGSGFVVRPGFVVTNAHVVAGFDWLAVRDQRGEYPATAIQVDPGLDIAVLAVPDLQAPALPWADAPVVRGTEGASLGFPLGQPQLVVRPATVRARLEAVGRDIYGQGTVRGEILAISAQVEHGDSGGPFVTSDGRVGGVVFGGDTGDDTGYALTVDEVRPVVEEALARNQEVGVGACRF